MSKSSQCKQGGTQSATSKNKEEMAQLKEEIKQLKSERKDQTQKIKGLNKKVKDLESELANAKHGLESKAPDFLQVISGDTIENYKEKMKKLEEENQRLNSRHNDTDNGKDIEKNNKSLVERNQELDKEVKKLKKQLQKQPTDVPQQSTDIEPDNSDSSTLKANLQRCMEKIKELEQERDDIKLQMKKMEEEKDKLIAQNDARKIVDFEKADKENKSLREKVKSLEEDITSVRDDNKRLMAKQADKNTETEGDMKTKDASIKLDDIKVQLRKVNEEKDALIAQNNESNNERIKLEREKTSLEEDKNKQGITISELQTKIEDLKRNLEESQLEMKRMEKEIGRLKTQNTDSSKKDISRLQRENASLVNDLTKQETEISKLNKQMEDFDREMKTKEEKIEQLTRQLESRGQKKENKKGEKSSSAEKISRLEGEVEGLRNRLSKIAGAQLVDNNPAISDLSDPNRPLSLGEKFSELYDNEWTDAMEELSDSSDERAVIKQLLEIVVESYQFCCEQSDKFMDRINGTMEMFSGNLVSEMPKEISKTNKDFRKSLAVHCVYHLQEEFTNKNSIGNRGKKTKDYMKKCVQVCWFMTVQDPKVVINYKVTGQFDEDRFKAYTKKGKQVDYLVWPALYLHEGGPVISKGVAQGK